MSGLQDDYRVDGRVLLKDNRQLTPEEFDHACPLRERLVQLVQGRSQFVEEQGLDREFCYPGGNWSFTARERGHQLRQFFLAYRHVAEGDYEVINHLRFFSQSFTGYQLFSLSEGYRKRSVNPIPKHYDEWIVATRPEPDTWVGLWLDAVKSIPSDYVISPPRMLGEVGWNVRGIAVNHDTYVFQERVNILYEAGLLNWLAYRASKTGIVKILEIGGGYGALAHAITRIIPNSMYVICDLPEALLFSGLYLGLTSPRVKLTTHSGIDARLPHKTEIQYLLIPNYSFDELLQSGHHFDLAINTLSFSEMTEKQVRTYAAGISSLLGNAGVLFEQNQDNRHIGLNYCKELIKDYFAHARLVSATSAHGTQGVPHLWANRPLEEIISSDFIPEAPRIGKEVEP